MTQDELFKFEDFDKPRSQADSYYYCNNKFKEFLSKGTVVYSKNKCDEREVYVWDSSECLAGNAKSQGILVNIRPIEPEDSAEVLLKEMLELEQSITWRMPDRLIERARKLIGAKK